MPRIVCKLDFFDRSWEHIGSFRARDFEIRLFTIAHNPIESRPTRSILNSKPIGVLIYRVFQYPLGMLLKLWEHLSILITLD